MGGNKTFDFSSKKKDFLTKNANFGPNLVVFGQKILFFTGEIKSFVTHITENPPRHLVRIVFWSGIRSNGPKMPIFGPKCQFLAKFGLFWAQNPIFLGQGVKFWYPRIGIPMRHLFRVENIDRWGSNWPLGAKMCFFDPKIWIFGAKSQFFCLVIAIFVDGTNDHYTRGSNFPIGTTPKKLSVSELGVIFWGSPLFLAVFGH